MAFIQWYASALAVKAQNVTKIWIFFPGNKIEYMKRNILKFVHLKDSKLGK